MTEHGVCYSFKRDNFQRDNSADAGSTQPAPIIWRVVPHRAETNLTVEQFSTNHFRPS
ncbi:MAG: hypothetical protein ACI8Z1_001876 [Candidatus Azotimanducaceae bacterium]|jgi:hypothetical protein